MYNELGKIVHLNYMINLYIDDTKEYPNGIIEAFATTDIKIAENMKIIYDELTFQKILHIINSGENIDGFHIFYRFCDLIVLFNWEPSLGATIIFTDFNNSIDNALDTYIELGEKKWQKIDRDKIMELFQDIILNPSNKSIQFINT